MAQLVTHCPRCDAQRMTFDVKAQERLGSEYGWQHWWEVYAVCGHCHKGTIFHVGMKDPIINHALLADFVRGGPTEHPMLNDAFEVGGYVSVKDGAAMTPPDHVPENVAAAFREGATCIAAQCWNAAGCMFRLAIDLATRGMMPTDPAPAGPNRDQRQKLGLRLAWLLDNRLLDSGLRELSKCVKDDGDDGAHEGTLTEAEAEDLQDFTVNLLERIFTEPARIKLAEQRKLERRKPKT